MPNRAGRWFEAGLFASRWLLAPFYAGLVAALVVLLWVFGVELWTELAHLPTMKPDDAILMALSLIDLSLAANLVLIVIFSGYENFVSRIDHVSAHPDRPVWMGSIDFSGIKMKLIASIVAIAAISLLKAYMKIDEGIETAQIQWMVIMLLTFVVSGVLLALMDFIHARSGGH